MSLKLIREAQLRTTLSDAEIKALSVIKEAVGASTIVDIVEESFTPSADDYDAWLRVVVGEAQDRGINLNKRSEFMQLVMDVLENDPAMPPVEMQEAIAQKMWQDYKAAKDEVRINKIAQAKEEEEKVEAARKLIADRFAKGPTPAPAMPGASDEEEEMKMGISDHVAAQKIFDKIKGTPNLKFVNVERLVAKYAPMLGKAQTDVKYIAAQVYGMLQDAGMEEEESGFAQAVKTSLGMEDEQEWFDLRGVPNPNGAYDAAGNYYRERDTNFEDEEPSFVRDAIKDSTSALKGSFLSHLRGEDDLSTGDEPDVEIEFGPDGVEGVADDEVFTSDDDECECPCADAESDVELDAGTDDEMGPPEDELDDETMDDVDADVTRTKEKVYDEEEAVKSFFRQAATAPRDLMNQAVKDIEAEGKAAWKSANVPKNPHPQKSQAYRAWQKGMTAAAKEALGIVDKPANPKAKAKPKRKK